MTAVGLCVHIEGIADIEQRMAVVRKRASYKNDPAGFKDAWKEEGKKLRNVVIQAKELLEETTVSDAMLRLIA